MSTKVKIVNLSSFNLPEYKTELSAGLDLQADISEDVTLGSLERILIPTNIKIAIPEDYEVQIRPRSGLTLKDGVVAVLGTIDADYRGFIGIIIVNLNKGNIVIRKGDRVAQMVLKKVERVSWEEVQELDITVRGEKGFGSTGKNG